MKQNPDSDSAQLEKKRARLLNELRRVEAQMGEAKERSASSSITEAGSPSGPSRPVRALLLDALDDLKLIAFTRELAIYCRARYGRNIPATRFGTIADDEVKSYFRGKRPRTVWLCFALTADRAEPIKRVLGRSDWPLASRIVAPTTGRVQHLKMTARLCELAEEMTAVDIDMLRISAADHARDLPGVKLKRSRFELTRWREIALDELAAIEPRDRELREEAAEKWSLRLPEPQQLFGGFEAIEGGHEGVLSTRKSS